MKENWETNISKCCNSTLTRIGDKLICSTCMEEVEMKEKEILKKMKFELTAPPQEVNYCSSEECDRPSYTGKCFNCLLEELKESWRNETM